MKSKNLKVHFEKKDKKYEQIASAQTEMVRRRQDIYDQFKKSENKYLERYTH
jgi:hypothetical protein